MLLPSNAGFLLLSSTEVVIKDMGLLLNLVSAVVLSTELVPS